MSVSYLNFRQLKNVFVYENYSISKIIESIDQAAIQIALALDESGKLSGIITDGDIRRGLLKGISLQDLGKLVLNQNYKFGPEELRSEEARVYMHTHALSHLPILNETKEVLGMFVADRLLTQKTKDNHVVIMAGGRGSRLHPLTLNTPKPLIKYGSKTLIEHVLDQCKYSGFKNFIISVNYLKDKIIDFLGDGSKLGVSITYIQEDFPLGTAGSLSLITEDINISDDFLVLNSDVVHNTNLSSFLEFHQEGKYTVTLGVKPHQVSVPYGVLQMKDNRVNSVVEKPVFNYLINAGIYALNKKVLNLVPKQEFFNTTDLITSAIGEGFYVGAYQLYEDWTDVGTRENLINSHEK